MKRLIAATVGTTLAVLSFSGTAQAGLLGTTTDVLDGITAECDQTGIQQRFIDWNDRTYYVPAPGGAFDEVGDWQLNGNASHTRKGNPFGTDRGAIQLKAGGAALSPPICVDVDYTVSRMFAKTSRASHDGSELNVEVIYPKLLGGSDAKASSLEPVADWGPTAQWAMPTLNQIGITGQVEVRFLFNNPETSRATWTIDDVWVDPRMRR